MFESLLEKVLNKFLGDFLDGFDAQNLHVGIWSGEVTISNVSLKADVIKMLELPIKLCFSHIGRLKLNVPWKSLTTAPVEVTLSDLFIIISAEHPDAWQFQDYAGFKKKFELLEKFKEQIIKNITDKAKPKDDKEAGYVQKLVLRIIDNIQLSISNIHIRFEDTIRSEFSWGISLKNIEIYTCDKDWKKKYFDRTKEENKAVPLQKLLLMTNIGAYWMQNETNFYNAITNKEEKLKKMEQMIISNQDPRDHPYYAQFVILLNAQGQLIQNTSGKFDAPEFNLTLDLKTIDLALENLQLQQIIRIAELFSLFQNKLTKVKKQKLTLSSDQIEQQKKIFLELYEKILRSPDQTAKALTKDENDLFEQSVSNLDIDLLCDAAKQIIKQVQKELAIKQAEEQKKKSGGWFSWGKKKDDTINSDEQAQLEAFIDQLADQSDIKEIKRPPDYVWILVNVSLEAGSVHVMKQFENKREGIKLQYSQFTANVQVRDSSMTLTLGLQSINLDVVSEPIIDGIVSIANRKSLPILFPISQQKFLEFIFETNPAHHPGVDKYIKLRTESLQFVFNPILLVRVQQFIDFQIKDETLKNAAWDQVEAAQDLASNQVAQSAMSPSILFLDILLAAPIVVLPIRDTTENWLINLGQVSVQTPRIDDKHYDHFEVSLRQLTFKHFKNIEECQALIYKNAHLTMGFSVIENFKITINAQVLRGSSKPDPELAQVAVQGVLPMLDLKINPTIYARIVKIADCFEEPLKDPEEIERKTNRLSLEKAMTERQTLMQNASKVGKIWRRGNPPLNTYTQYTAVLSGGYIYLFSKPKDQQPESCFWIRNSDFFDVEVQDGSLHAFLVKNKYGETVIGCEKASVAQQWKDAIEEMRTQPRVEKKQKKEQQEMAAKQQDTVSRPMNFGFVIEGFQLVINSELNQEMLKVGISGLGANAQMQNGSISLDLKLRDLFVTDGVQNYLNPELKYVVKCDPDPESKELISIKLNQYSPKDPNYKNVNLQVSVYFGTLQVYAKPLVIAKLLVFLVPEEQKNDVQVNKEKLERDQAKKAIEDSAGQQATKSDASVNAILMLINVRIQSIKATLVHRFTNLPLAELNIQNTEVQMKKLVDELDLGVKLGNLQMIDLSNYPNTLCLEEEYSQIKPKEMIGVKVQEQSLLTINLKLFTDNSPKIKNNVNIIIDVEMSQIIINFMMQPVLRLLDYSLQQLLFALSNPHKSIDPSYVAPQAEKVFVQRQDKKSTTIVLNQEEQDFLAKQLKNPPALGLNVRIFNPQVILKPTQESKSCMIIDLGQIAVSSVRSKALDRVDKAQSLPDGVWVDTFVLNMRDIQIYQQSETEKREFSLPFDFNVAVQIFSLCPQYVIHYPELNFDPSLKIFCYLAPMIVQLTHKDYMFLMKCLALNIAFDDGFDSMIRAKHPEHFQAFFDQQKEQEEKLKEMLQAENDNAALTFQLDIENMTAFLLEEKENKKPVPFLRMTLVMMRVGFQKCNNGTAKVALEIQDMEGSVFQIELEDFVELPFIGSMNLRQQYSYEQVVNLDGLVRGRSATTSQQGTALILACKGQLSAGPNRPKIFRFEDVQTVKEQKALQHKLRLSLDMHLNGNKKIDLDLADFKLQLQTKQLFQVLALIAMDDPDLQPPPAKYQEFKDAQVKRDQPDQRKEPEEQQKLQQIEPADKAKQQPAQQQGELQIKVSLKNVITCIATMVENNVLAIRGVFEIGLMMKPLRPVEEVRAEIEKNQVSDRDWDKLNVQMRLDALLKDIEICIVKSTDLTKRENFQQVKKREILKPLTVKVTILKQMEIQKDLRTQIEMTKIDAYISQAALRVSFKDLFTLQSGLNYQMLQMPKQEQQAAPAEQPKQEVKKQELNVNQLSQIKIDVQIDGTNVVVLNDMGNTFTPLFEFEMDVVTAIMRQNNIFLTIGVQLPFNLQYYNPKASCWEPVIEKAGFSIDIYKSMIGTGGNLITVEQSPSLERFNLNISTIFIQTVFRALYLVQKIFKPANAGAGQADPQKQSFSVEERQESEKGSFIEDLVQVSPYAARNYCGYPIIIEPKDDKSLPVVQLANTQSANLKLAEDEQIHSDRSKQKRVNVSIKMPNGEWLLNDIDLDRNKIKMHSKDTLKVFTIVKLDSVTNQRLLIIVSPIILVNYTNKTLFVQISDRKNNVLVKLNKHGQDSHCHGPIPFGYENAKFAIKLDPNDAFSEELVLDELIKSQDKYKEIQTRDKQYLLVNVVKDKNSPYKFKIHIEAPFRVTNSLPQDIYVQMLSNLKETTYTKKMKPEETIEDYQHSHFQKTYLRVLIQGCYWSDEYKLYAGKEEKQSKKDCLSELQLFDNANNSVSLLVFEPWRLSDYGLATREFIIHCSGYVKNLTGMKFKCGTVDKKHKRFTIAGQEPVNNGDLFDPNFAFLSANCGQLLELWDENLPDQRSVTPAPVDTIGEPQLDLIIQDPAETSRNLIVYIGAKIELDICNYKHTLFNKIITLTPRFVIVNQTQRVFLIRSADGGTYSQQVLPKERVPYKKLYQKDEKQGTFMVNIRPDDPSFMWSGGVDISSIGIVYFRVKNLQNQDEPIYMSCDNRQEGSTLFIILNEIPREQAPYKVILRAQNLEVTIPSLKTTLNTEHKEFYYAWDDPNQADKTLEVKVQVTTQPNIYKPLSYKLSPDHLGLFKVYSFIPTEKGPDRPTITIALSIKPDGFQKRIIIEVASQDQIKLYKTKPKQDFLRQLKEQQDQFDQKQGDDSETTRGSVSLSLGSSAAQEDRIENQINLKLKSVTISLIHNADNKKRPSEYMVITVRDIEFVQIASELFNAIQARIQYVNIDHNSQFFVNYPVILTPQKYGLYQKTDKSEGKYFLNVLIVRDAKVTDINLFQNIILEIDPFAIKVEELFINSILDYVKSIVDFKNKVGEFDKQQSVILSANKNEQNLEEEKQEEEKGPIIQWKHQELPPPSLPTYISQITISPIQIELTFQLQSKTSDFKTDDMAVFKSIAQALGVVLSDIDEAPLIFKGLQLDNCFDTVSGISSKMIKFYKNEGLSQILKLLGSLAVIGNPVGLFNNVSTGMKDLIQRPAEGFTKGPLEAGLGLAQGAGSLVSHTISGAFNSVSKITGSLGSGLSALSMDEEYIKQREKMRLQKPKHVGEGMAQAGKSLYQGISQGLTGVFLKPFQGAKQGGAKGFFKGLGQGMVGLVAKPVAGVLDAVQQTAQGIQNTVTYYDDKPNSTRARNIRPIYGYEGYYMDYIDLDAEGFAMIHFLKKGDLMENRFWSAYLILPDKNELDNKYMFVMTLENLIYMSFKTKKKVWIIPLNELAHADIAPQGIKIFVKKQMKQLNNKKETVIQIEPEQRDPIFKSLSALQEMYNYITQ